MITVQDVTKAFGPKKLFEDVNVSFAPGHRYGLTGPNGAGKSTFMKILSGDEEPDTGQVLRPKKLGRPAARTTSATRTTGSSTWS